MRFRSDLGSFLNANSLSGEGAEIGVFTGEFALRILNRWNGKKLWLVDPWSPQPDYLDDYNSSIRIMERRMHIAERRLAAHASRLGWIRDVSVSAARRFRPRSLDFVYIDANHGYEHVRRDLAAWYPKVRPGGIIAGHDYYNAIVDERLHPIRFGEFEPKLLTSYGVKAAVDEFAKHNRLAVSTTRERLPSWYFTKPRR